MTVSTGAYRHGLLVGVDVTLGGHAGLLDEDVRICGKAGNYRCHMIVNLVHLFGAFGRCQQLG